MDTDKIRKALRHLRDIGIVQAWPHVADHAREALAELDKPQTDSGVRFRSESSGMWYTDPKAAGDVDCVEVNGVRYVSNKVGQMFDKAPKVLTDEEIERYAESHSIWHRGKEPSPDGKRDGCAPDSVEEAFVIGAIWYRDNHSVAGLTVEEAHEIALRWVSEEDLEHGYTEQAAARLRARLTAAIKAKR